GVPSSGVKYQWFADGKAISKATAATYVLTTQEVGKHITVQAIYTDNAKHQESPTSSGTSTVVNPAPQNHAPTNISLSANKLMENKAGATVGKLSTTDQDAGDTHTYKVNDSRFEVSSDGTLKLKAGTKIDYETTKSIALKVTSTDKGGLSTEKSFTIDIQDDPSYPAPKVNGADAFGKAHVPKGETFKIAEDLGDAKALAAKDPNLKYIVVSDGDHHALLHKGATGSNVGMTGWSADFTKAGYVFAAAFQQDSAKGDISPVLKSALAAAQKLSMGVELAKDGDYTTSQKIALLEGVKFLHGNNSLIKVGSGISDYVVKFAAGSSGTTKNPLEISELVLDMNGSGARGILAEGVKHAVIRDNTIYHGTKNAIEVSSVTHSTTHKKLTTDDVTIENNHISLPAGVWERGGPTAIYIGGKPIIPNDERSRMALADTKFGDDYERFGLYVKAGKFYTADPSLSTTNIHIKGNHIDGGRYGIGFDYVTGKQTGDQYSNEISGNFFTNNTRNISLQNSSQGILIKNNLLTDSLSASVLLGYNADNNRVENNVFHNKLFQGQASVQIDNGSENNVVTGNHIETVFTPPALQANPNLPKYGTWHIYAGADVSNTIIENNTISGEVRKSSIAVESILYKRGEGQPESYVSSVESGKPNYGNPFAGGFGPVTNVQIRNNIIAPEIQGNKLVLTPKSSVQVAPVIYAGAESAYGWNEGSKHITNSKATGKNGNGSILLSSSSGNIIAGTSVYVEKVEDRDGYKPNTVKYQWYAGGKAISGANGTAYSLKANDIGKEISATVEYTDNKGNHEIVTGIMLHYTFKPLSNIDGDLSITSKDNVVLGNAGTDYLSLDRLHHGGTGQVNGGAKTLGGITADSDGVYQHGDTTY
ncbi:MAG: right-handed parallel beta-helix repeat-containing protein, partial [Cardiobacteriaceae bacterium]|nr:right-handed parallel beta-helix repeat-containing protein [Cardiobacteriaceae bacterium]